MQADFGMSWGEAASFCPWRAVLREELGCEPSASNSPGSWRSECAGAEGKGFFRTVALVI